jgi:hypothetical protein
MIAALLVNYTSLLVAMAKDVLTMDIEYSIGV